MQAEEPLTTRISNAKRALDAARVHGDKLMIELAEDGLNDLLGRVDVTHVTGNERQQ